MIVSSDGARFVDGVTMTTHPMYKRENGDVVHGEFYVMNVGRSLRKTTPIYVYDTPASYHTVALSLIAEGIYSIQGVCAPVRTTVFMSHTPDELNADSLADSVITQTTSDSEGSYVFTNVTGIADSITLWICVSANDAQIASLTGDAVMTGTSITSADNIAMKTVLVSPITHSDSECDMCRGSGNANMGEMCRTCDGHGYSLILCPVCGGAGVLYDEYDVVDPYRPCPRCEMESGYAIDYDNPCDDCRGSGYTYVQCASCNGLGYGEWLTYTGTSHSVSGTCSDDVESIYVSKIGIDDGIYNSSVIDYDYSEINSISVEALVDNAVGLTSSKIENGSWTLKFNSVPYANVVYAVWGRSSTGGVILVDSIDRLGYTKDGTCLSADTLITMHDGSQRRMDEIKAEDIVLAENGVLTKVHRTARGSMNPYHILYRFEDGTTINETHDHRFYNVEQGFWQRLKHWNIGDHAISQNGSEVALVSVERIEEEAEMFGIFTETGTYYANGLLSGAAECNKPLLANATTEQAVDMLLSIEEKHILNLLGLDGVLP